MKTELQKKAYWSGLAIIMVTILVLGVSYAWLSLTLNGTKNNVIKAGTLALTLDDGTSVGISQLAALPISDDKGLELTPYTFSLENTGDIDSVYTIYIDDQAAEEGETAMPDTMVKLNIAKNNTSLKTSLLSGIGAHPNRVLDSGTIKPGEKFTYNLRLWIDSAAGEEVMGTTYRGMIRVEATQVIQRLPEQP